MFILNRYLLRQFLQVFVICFLSLTGLYIVIDAFGHLDHFSSYAEKEGNLFGVIGELLRLSQPGVLRRHERHPGDDLGHVHRGVAGSGTRS